jgi:hypothetical protein
MDEPIDALNSRRDAVLLSDFPVRDAPHQTTSTTKSRYRMRWRTLERWNNFEDGCLNYFHTVVTEADRAALIMNNFGLQRLFASVNSRPARTEEDIKGYLLTFVMEVHNDAARGTNGAPLPSDSHATFIRTSGGAGNAGLNGNTDFAMYADLQRRPCLVGEVKNPWMVTPQLIDEVLNGKST